MYQIPCPWCGPREEVEFSWGGEAHIRRPTDPAAVSDAEWADYLFMRKNPKGLHTERIVHSQGCRRWFHIVRNTTTDEILGVYRIGEAPPPLPETRLPATPCGEPALGSGLVPVAGAEDAAR